MAHWKIHAQHCKELLGNEHYVVHQWLDELVGKTWPSKYHRTYRHHSEGLEEIREKWGDEAYKAGMIHILTDEGQIMNKKEIKKHYDELMKRSKT